MTWWIPPVPLSPTEIYWQTLSTFSPEIQSLVMQSRELERTNLKAAKRLLFENPQVVLARKLAAQAAMGRT